MKKNSIISLLAVAVLTGLCGCASDQGQKAPAPVEPKPVKDTRTREERLKTGMTQDEVRTIFGNPKGKSVNGDGTQTWMYNDSEKAFIPNYSLFGGKIHHTAIVFDADGTVKSWSFNNTGRY